MGPDTRRLFDEFRLRQARAASDESGQAEGAEDQQENRSEPSRQSADDAAMKAAVFSVIPERLQRTAKILSRCTICLCIFALFVIGSVEWHWHSLFWSPLTASAEELRKLEERVSVQETDSSMALRLLQEQSMIGLHQIICASPDSRLTIQLNSIRYEYRKRNNWLDYELPECPKKKEGT